MVLAADIAENLSFEPEVFHWYLGLISILSDGDFDWPL